MLKLDKRNFFTGGNILLTKFSVKSFKNFDEKIILDLRADNYEFNTAAIKNNHINTGIIYGQNASGKTNFIYAIMDITTHLTDFHKTNIRYKHYLNMDNDSKYAEFEYHFIFNNNTCIYTYQKEDLENINYEKLMINEDLVFEYSLDRDIKKLNLVGAENLDLDLGSKKLSFLKYIFKNAVYNNDVNKDTLNCLEEFVEGMLTFNSVDGNNYQGFTLGGGSINEYIIKQDKLKDFNNFLNQSGININLIYKEVDGEKDIYAKFKNGETAKFFTVASKGTRALALFYRWLIDIEKIKFMLIDEFDAYYHHELSKTVLEKIRDSGTQTIVTTHNTSIMSNDLLRPDCYFIIEDNIIKSISNSTNKELRKAHNIEKMYRSGAFDNE